MDLEGLKGTRDFYPEDFAKVNYIYENTKKVSKRFGFEEFEAPIIGKAQMWLEKSGGEIPEQMYVFESKGKELVALRPELTPDLARMVAKKFKELKKPIKWFSFPRCFRYEQPQSGRLREFFQYNADILGGNLTLSTFEIVSLLIEMLKSLRLNEKDICVKLNDRRLTDSILERFEVKQENKQDIMRIIDKRDKLPQKVFLETLGDYFAKPKDFIAFLDLPLEKMKLNVSGENAKKEFLFLQNLFKKAGYSNFVEYDATVVRGLGYYTSFVFEVNDRIGKYRAIAGGGTYSNLVSQFDKSIVLDGVGFGMGDVVLGLLLEEKKLFPKLNQDIDFFIATIGYSQKIIETAINIATDLRQNGKTVYMNLIDKGLSKQFEFANFIGAKKAIIIGERDLEEDKITVKDLVAGKEKKESLKNFKC